MGGGGEGCVMMMRGEDEIYDGDLIWPPWGEVCCPPNSSRHKQSQEVRALGWLVAHLLPGGLDCWKVHDCLDFGGQ